MSDVKHKPATALPWILRGGAMVPGGPMRGARMPLFIEAPKANGMPYGLDVLGDDYTGYGDDEAREQNVRYLFHAGHAYPELLELLASCPLSTGPNFDEWWNKRNALFAKLGENIR